MGNLLAKFSALFKSSNNADLVKQMRDGNHFAYSAISDEDTCAACQQHDLKTADDPRKLPSAPNPACVSARGCRCDVIIIHEKRSGAV